MSSQIALDKKSCYDLCAIASGLLLIFAIITAGNRADGRGQDQAKTDTVLGEALTESTAQEQEMSVDEDGSWLTAAHKATADGRKATAEKNVKDMSKHGQDGLDAASVGRKQGACDFGGLSCGHQELFARMCMECGFSYHELCASASDRCRNSKYDYGCPTCHLKDK